MTLKPAPLNERRGIERHQNRREGNNTQNTMKTAFKNIHVFSCFDFDHDGVATWSGANGPWRKVSARKYVHLETPSREIRVGTINVMCKPRYDLNCNP